MVKQVMQGHLEESTSDTRRGRKVGITNCSLCFTTNKNQVEPGIQVIPLNLL